MSDEKEMKAAEPSSINPEFLGLTTQPIFPAGSSSYPASPTGYPEESPGYTAEPPGYPASSSDYPEKTSGYPAAQNGYPAGPSNYNAAQSGYPVGSYGCNGYPASQPGYPVSPPMEYFVSTNGYPQQPIGIPLQPGAQYQAGNTVVVVQQPVSAPAPLHQSFTGHIIFSCFATWCCFWPLGLVAFILALVAQSQAPSDGAGARKLGIASYVLSSLAVAAGITTIIVVAVLVSNASATYSYNYYDQYSK